MISTFVIAVALAVGADEPAPWAPRAFADEAAEVFKVTRIGLQRVLRELPLDHTVSQEINYGDVEKHG